MATTTTQFHEFDTGVPVRSRVSWGPILAGSAVAFATYFLLSLLGAAIGLSVSDNMQADNLGMGAAIWAIVTVIIAFFVGGWVVSRFTVGEDKLEAVLYGAILWGVTFLLLLWLVGSGIGMGFNAIVTMDSGQQPAAAGQAAPGMNEQVRNTATQAAWWAFAGTALSMLAAIGGSLVGAKFDEHGHATARMQTHTHPTGTGMPRPAM